MEKPTGKIKFFNKTKGFGFILQDSGGNDLFVHANDVEGDPDALKEGQKVEYVVGEGRKGPEAKQVVPIP